MPSRPEPVAIAGVISAVVSAVLVVFGIQLTDDLSAAVDAIVVAAAALVPIAMAWIARSKVTPVASPQAADGTPLVKR